MDNRTDFPSGTPGLRLGCVIMASGMSTRFGGNKLMADFGGAPMIARILQATDGLFARRVVVTRHADVAAFCRASHAEVVMHDLPLRSDTVRLGLSAVGDADGCLFCPADQPLLSRTTLCALIRAFAFSPQAIWRPAYGGEPGSPVLFPAWAFGELLALPGGKGGGYVASRHPESVRTLPLSSPDELLDADTPEALARLLVLHRQAPRA